MNTYTKKQLEAATKITRETLNHEISAEVAAEIKTCTTRAEVATVLTQAGYSTHVGGHHVAALVFGRRVALITNPILPDFN